MKQVLIQDDDTQWWLFEVPPELQDHHEATFYPAGYTGPYFAVQPYMDGDGWEDVEGCAMGPAFKRCINGALKVPHLLFGMAGDEGGVKGKRLKLKDGVMLV